MIETMRRSKRMIETYVKDTTEMENINSKYENHYTKLARLKFLSKYQNLKNKKWKGFFLITNEDLEIFKIKSESTDHIVLSHIDDYNLFRIDVSISKFNYDLFGNFIFYNLMFYGL